MNMIRRAIGAAVAASAIVALGAPAALANPATAATAPMKETHHEMVIDRRAPVAILPGGDVSASGSTVSSGIAKLNAWSVARNVQYVGQQCGTNVVDQVSGMGPMTLTLTSSRAVATTWSASASIDAGAVSAGVGFSVTETVTNTESGSYAVPAGTYGYLKAYPLYDVYAFDVYNLNLGGVVGYGQVSRPVGYCYDHTHS